MLPYPNVLAGVLIGAVNSPWSAVLGASLGWGIVWCLYVWICNIHTARIVFLRERGKHLLFGSPAITFWAIEWIIGFSTAPPIGTVVYFARLAF